VKKSFVDCRNIELPKEAAVALAGANLETYTWICDGYRRMYRIHGKDQAVQWLETELKKLSPPPKRSS
jgi:hypothetical protein